jgi:hypothetical protein
VTYISPLIWRLFSWVFWIPKNWSYHGKIEVVSLMHRCRLCFARSHWLCIAVLFWTCCGIPPFCAIHWYFLYFWRRRRMTPRAMQIRGSGDTVRFKAVAGRMRETLREGVADESLNCSEL